ncbi:MAG: VIT family protein [Caldimonas sp.]
MRAAVLGANDGIISTASMIAGVAAAHASHGVLLTTGLAGLVAGAMSMAAGEYVSVHSQADTESADISRERSELTVNPHGEERELAAIYVHRGVETALAQQVAKQLMLHDALGAHARDELGLSERLQPKPVQAALASAASFGAGAALPLIVTVWAPVQLLLPWLMATSLLFLACLGATAAKAGGASLLQGAWRVLIWGALAIGVTAGAGALFGTTL